MGTSTGYPRPTPLTWPDRGRYGDMNTIEDPVFAATRAAAAVRRQQRRVAELKAGAGRDPEGYAAAVRRLGVLIERHAEAVRKAVRG